MAADDFEAVSHLMSGVLQLYQTKNDILAVQSVQGRYRELLANCTLREQQIVAALQEMEWALAERKAASDPSEAEAAHANELAAANEEIERVQARTSALEEQMQREERLLEDLRKEAEIAKERRRELEKLSKEKMPRIVFELSLYAKITGIMWDQEAPPGRVKGYVSKPKSGDVIPFDFDTEAQSRFELCNSLWALLHQSGGEGASKPAVS
eukprot:TRINITY_DN4658_c4_g1_i1.p1 TRINITY_DN4658_c4_g1~~TRINITY_DN4658_c4_g1_i1.p1  ORF type:complete len:223 (-),score=64.53 TRINITY_DN4658_c4_g1_i1:112-744(-)